MSRIASNVISPLAIFLLFIVLVGAGCVDSRPSLDEYVVESSEPDFFEKKQECSKYLSTYLDRWNNQTAEDSLYSRPEVCFDSERNTCVLIEEYIYTDSNFKMVEITDLLTNKSLFFRTMSLDESSARWEETDAVIAANTNCAE